MNHSRDGAARFLNQKELNFNEEKKQRWQSK
jgi:hypothetical protein